MNTRWRTFGVLVFALAIAFAACGDDDGGSAAGEGCDGEIPEGSTIEIWWHEGAEAEVDVVEGFVDDFNASQDAVEASLTLVPEADYASQLSGAAASGDFPDVADTDASFAFNYAWSGDLQPISSCIPDDLMADLLPSIVEQGKYAGETWAVGMFDSGLGAYVRADILEENGIRIPTGPEDAWTIDEFDEILATLREAGYEQPLDLKKNYGQGEYYSYLYEPFVWSAGGALLADDGSTADSYLNSEEAVAALTRFQQWHEMGYVDDNEDDAAFVEGRTPISFVGHWEYNNYKDTFGDDVVIVPLPDFGEGTVSGQGSWQWGIGSQVDADAAWSFVDFTLQPEQMEQMADASGTIPSRASVAESIDRFAEGGDEYLYVEQLTGGYTQPRPPHPAYATISSAFNQAIQDIIDGQDVQTALDNAVATIDQDIEDNEGYPEPST